MPHALAETIRGLRRDHRLSYEELAIALAQSELDRGQSHGLGKALTEVAALELDDDDHSWH
jgi:hypothetical protein